MKIVWLKTLLFSAAVIIAGFFIGNMHKICKQYDRTVQVKGLSEREVEADLAVWPINISLAANDLNILSGDIEKQNNEVYDFFIAQGFTWRPIEYIFTGLNDLKPSMIEEATKNAREVAEKFARDSDASVGKIRTARQGLFTINDRDENTPQIKTVRVVTTIDFQSED